MEWECESQLKLKDIFSLIWVKEANFDTILARFRWSFEMFLKHGVYKHFISLVSLSLSLYSHFLRFLESRVWFCPALCLRTAWWWCSSCGALGRFWAWILQKCPLWVYCRRDCSTWATAWVKCRTCWSGYSRLLCPTQDCLKDTGWGENAWRLLVAVISVLSGLFTTSVSSDPLTSARQRHISVYIWH